MPTSLRVEGADAVIATGADWVTLQGIDGISATGSDGISAAGSDAAQRVGLQSLDPELALLLDRATDDSNINAYPGAPTNCESGQDLDCDGVDDYTECFGDPGGGCCQ